MSMYKITKLLMPDDVYWGRLQINNLTNTHFRFYLMDDGNPMLDTSFFVNTSDTDKHRPLDPTSEFYQGIQRALIDYFKTTVV